MSTSRGASGAVTGGDAVVDLVRPDAEAGFEDRAEPAGRDAEPDLAVDFVLRPGEDQLRDAVQLAARHGEFVLIGHWPEITRTSSRR
jgi:hypothetical protein